MPRNEIRQIALAGMLAAVAVVIMCLGGFLSIATYVCPLLCAMTQFLVLRFCGKRLAWAWFGSVSVLSLLLGPDKEAALVFLMIGYYPLLKGSFEKSRLQLLWKTLYFNASVLLLYGLLMNLLGLQDLTSENQELGMVGGAVLLILGNITFFLLDKLLGIMAGKLR